MQKSIFALALLLASVLLLSSCNSTDNGEESQASSAQTADSEDDSAAASQASSDDENTSETDALLEDGHFTKYDLDASYGPNDTAITLDDDGITVSGPGAATNGNTVTITSPGTYILSGVLSDGQIIVEVAKSEKVRLVFNGVDITCAASAPVWIKSSDKTVVTLAEGSSNTLTDASSYTNTNADNGPNACLFSKDDLTINGGGSLIVTGNHNNGIGSKDDLKIISGSIVVTAKNNALKGSDSVAIAGGRLSVTSKDDGIKTTNDTDEGKGYIYICGGEISVKSGDDALQAEQAVTVTGGIVSVNAVGKDVNCAGVVEIADGCIEKQK